MKEPKTLLFDIETAPILAWIWNTGKQFVTHDQLKDGQKSNIICICYKWAHERKVHSLDWGYHAQCSYDMLERFGEEVAKADLIIGQNSDRFDIRHINTQRLLNDMPPISWPTSEDTLKQLRKYFYLPSYRLDYVAKLLTGSGKDKMAFSDWVNIVERKDKKAFHRMIKYCCKDVLALEAVWKKIKAHCKAKVSAATIVGDACCPRCGTSDPICDGFKYLVSGKYQRFQCVKCVHKWRDTKRAK